MREKKMDDMNESDVFDPGDLRCKAPYGAVRAGETVRLTLRPLRTMGFSRGEVTLRYEFDREPHRDHSHAMDGYGLGAG